MPGEVPEHLLARSRERRKALGLPVPGEEGGGEGAAPPESPAEAQAAEAPAAEAPAAEAPAAAAAEAPAAEARPTGDAASKIPAHLLARSAARKAAKAGGT